MTWFCHGRSIRYFNGGGGGGCNRQPRELSSFSWTETNATTGCVSRTIFFSSLPRISAIAVHRCGFNTVRRVSLRSRLVVLTTHIDLALFIFYFYFLVRSHRDRKRVFFHYFTAPLYARFTHDRRARDYRRAYIKIIRWKNVSRPAVITHFALIELHSDRPRGGGFLPEKPGRLDTPPPRHSSYPPPPNRVITHTPKTT